MLSVDFYAGQTLICAIRRSPYSATFATSTPGSYSLTAVAHDADGNSTTSGAVPVTVQAAGDQTPTGSPTAPADGATGGAAAVEAAAVEALPSGQIAADVGSPAVAGQTSYSGGTYTVRGGGADIWDPVDQFQFVYQPVTGDTQIVARVVSMTNTDSWAKAGVMIRETLTGNSRHATLAITPTSSIGAWFARRSQAGGTTIRSVQGTTTAPAWVRLVRAGNVITAHWSTNGTAWTLVGSDTVPFGGTVYVGLVANSHSGSAATTVVFDNVSITTGSGNQAPTVGLTAPANGATFTARRRWR